MEFKLSTQDLFHMILKKKMKLILWMALCSAAFSLFALSKPVRYLAEGSFREKGKSNSSFDTNKAAMVLIGGNQREAEGEPIFKSRRVLSEVVKKIGLQAVVDPAPSEPGIVTQVFLNLYIEWSHFMNWDEPLFEESVLPFKVRQVDYPHDYRKAFSLIFKEGFIQLKDKKTGAVFSGKPGELIKGDRFSLIVNPQEAIEGKIYTLTLLPFSRSIKDLNSALKVQADKNDKTLIKLSYVSKDRFLGKEVLAALMDSYLDYLEKEQDAIHEKQIGYLENRQIESFASLKKKMEMHAQELAKDALHHGFIGSDKAIQFFAAHQEQLQTKKEQADLMIKSLRELIHHDTLPLDRLLSIPELPILVQKTQQLSEMHTLRDSLSLALWDPKSDLDPHQFALRVKEWEDLQQDALEIDKLIVALDEKGVVDPPAFEGKIKFFIHFWQDQVSKSLHAFNEGSKENFYPLFNDFCRKKESFKSTLQNLKSFIDVQSTALKEELVYSKEIEEEFKGIDLQLSQDLFKRYMTQLEELQAQERHLSFLKDQIRQEDFAISSLSTILQDSIASDLVNRAATLELAIRDPKNRSEKEQQRMHDELNLERSFLGMHLDQTLQLNHIKQNLLKEKFTSLQQATLGFLHRQISFIEHQIKDLIQSKIDSLEHERELFQEQIHNLGDQLASYPEKWVRDELLKQAMQIQQLQAQEITRIVENKNIASNLELIQSSPLDNAFPPPLPIQPMVPLFAFLGGFLGFIAAICSILGSFITRGIPATRGNLELQGQKVLGKLTEPVRDFSDLLDSDLETFRSIFFQLKKRALIAGMDIRWGKSFANYVRKTDKKVLFLDLNFNSPFDPKGLFNYLKEGIYPVIVNDQLSFGGTTRSYLELLTRKEFAEWLNQIEKDYDFVIASIQCGPQSAAVPFLSQFFDQTVISLHNESLEQLKNIFKESYLFIQAL